MKRTKLPADWKGPMLELARLLRSYGAKRVRWNSQIVQALMLWGFKHLMFYKIHHGKKKKKYAR